VIVTKFGQMRHRIVAPALAATTAQTDKSNQGGICKLIDKFRSIGIIR